MLRNLRYYLYLRLTYIRDWSPHWITNILDYIRYEWLYDYEDERHWWD